MLRRIMTQVGFVGVLCFSATTSIWAETAPLENPLSPSPTLPTTETLLTNLATYFGYNISAPLSDFATTSQWKLLDKASDVASYQQANLFLYLGTILTKNVVPTGEPLSTLNTWVNAIFYDTYSTTPDTNTSQSTKFTLKVNPMIDQENYQNNPVNQAILNALTTPDYSFCLSITCPTTNNNSLFNTASNTSTPGSLASKCCTAPYRSQMTIGTSALGPLGVSILGLNKTTSAPDVLYGPLDTNTLNQLNGNTLIEPMVYSITPISKSTTPSSSGLTATTQAQEAENFIRYATGETSPMQQTTATNYNALLSMISNAQSTAAQKATAITTLSSYLSGLRSYTAQTSVGVANLYYIFSKRMVQNTDDSNALASVPTPSKGALPTTQALSEYRIATRRLYDPTITTEKGGQWVEQINNAPPATVQKEIAILLSEINYQLYLSRQQEERLLLANSVMLLQLGHLVAPSPPQAPQ